jgi:hypothetical protein
MYIYGAPQITQLKKKIMFESPMATCCQLPVAFLWTTALENPILKNLKAAELVVLQVARKALHAPQCLC